MFTRFEGTFFRTDFEINLRKCPTPNRSDSNLYYLAHRLTVYHGANNLVTLSEKGCLFSQKIAQSASLKMSPQI